MHCLPLALLASGQERPLVVIDFQRTANHHPAYGWAGDLHMNTYPVQCARIIEIASAGL
jgi:hypothetical protein